MQQKTLSGITRSEFNKNANRRLRRDGKIPAIVYGHRDPFAIAVDEHEFRTKFKVISENIIIKLTVNGETYDVLVKDYQEKLIKNQITHLDFYEIERGKLLKTHVPIHISGTAKGVKLGGIFEYLLHEVEIECLPKNLPEKIEVNIDDMDVGQSIHVSDLKVDTEVRFLTNANQVVCHVIRKKETVESEEGGEEAEGAKE